MSNSPQHDLHVDKKSNSLQGTRITICGGGGIAAIEMPKVGRELRRHGAEVSFFATENCLKFVGRESLEWASANQVIVNPSGFAEHICTSDLVIVFPATADLISKMAHGICPDGVTTLLQSALGAGVPIVVVPTMHASLSASPLVQKSRKILEECGVHFVAPRKEEGKDKAPNPETVALEASHHYYRSKRYGSGKIPSILVTLGGTQVPLDNVRCITNQSSGRLGIELLKNAYMRGFDVTAVAAGVSVALPKLDRVTLFYAPNYSDFMQKVIDTNTETVDGVFHLAAISDYIAQKAEGKIDSSKTGLQINLFAGKKLIDEPKLKKIRFQAGCKLTSGSNGKEIADRFLAEKQLNLLLWNTAESSFGDGRHEGVLFYSRNGETRNYEVFGKTMIAEKMIECFSDWYRRQTT